MSTGYYIYYNMTPNNTPLLAKWLSVRALGRGLLIQTWRVSPSVLAKMSPRRGRGA
jgi:hypothetical protein